MIKNFLKLIKKTFSNKKVLISLISFLVVLAITMSLLIIFLYNNSESTPDNRVKPVDQSSLQTQEEVEEITFSLIDPW